MRLTIWTRNSIVSLSRCSSVKRNIRVRMAAHRLEDLLAELRQPPEADLVGRPDLLPLVRPGGDPEAGR